MLKIIICGINGKMGTSIYESLSKRSHHVVCGVDKKTVSQVDCPVYSSFYQVKELADAIIDFSSPTCLNELLDYALLNKIPLVIGTTGYSETQENQVVQASKFIPVFKSANTSIGINLLLKLCKTATATLSGFDVEIIDKHHKFKRDSPSGTTKMIYNEIINAKNTPYTPVYGRNTNKARKSSEIGVHSIRGGTTVGEHTVCFFGEDETVTITHTASSKQLFAFGAIKATEFIVKKGVGLYDMNDLLNL